MSSRKGKNGIGPLAKATILALLAIALPLTCLPPASFAQAKLEEASRTELPNGLTLVLKEYHQIPIAYFSLIVPGGGAQEGTQKAGLAGFAANLLLKGTAHRDAKKISEEIDFLGGSLSAGVSYDYSSLALEVLSKDIDKGLELFFDCLLYPTYPQEELERMRSQALAALSQEDEDPGAIIGKRFRSLLFSGHPYGHPLGGSRASITSITRDDVTGFYRSFWIPSQAILVAVGDFQTEEMAEKLKRLLSDWPHGRMSVRPLSSPSLFQGRRVVLIDKPELTQANILLGNIGVPRDTPRLFPLALANGILGRMGFSSRLMNEIRANLGLAYDIDSQFSMGKVAGPFAIATSTQNGNVGKALSEILEQLRIFREKGITPEELAKVKTYKKGIYFIALQQSAALVAQMADIEFYNLPRDLIATYQERIDRVTLQEANDAARDLFPYEDLLIVILGKAEEIKGQLAGLGDLVIEPFRPE